MVENTFAHPVGGDSVSRFLLTLIEGSSRDIDTVGLNYIQSALALPQKGGGKKQSIFVILFSFQNVDCQQLGPWIQVLYQ